MITAKTLLKQLTGKDIYESLIHFMTEEFADFAAIRKRYEHAMDILRTKLGGEIVTDTTEAIRQQTVSNLLFCGCLGIKANLDNFLNPLARNFLDVDSEIYLREETAHRLPEYMHAQVILEQFYALVSPSYQAQTRMLLRIPATWKPQHPSWRTITGTYWEMIFFPVLSQDITQMRC